MHISCSFLLFAMAFSMCASCNLLGRRSPDSQILNVADVIYLGVGFDTETYQSREQCIKGDEGITHQPISSWNISAVQNWDSVKRDLGYEGEAEFVYAMAKGSPKAQFTRELRDTEFSATYVISGDYVKSTKYLQQAEIGPLYSKRLQEGLKLGDFRRICGNHYVSRIDIGGKIRILVKFKFSNREIKRTFHWASAGTSAPVNGSVDMSPLDDSLKNASEVIVTFHQEGGELSHISQDISASNGVGCNPSNWEKCRLFIKGLMTYSSSTFPADVAAGSTNTIGFISQPYPDLTLPNMTTTSREKMTNSTREWERQDYDKMKVELILGLPQGHTINDRKLELEKIFSTLKRNMEKLTANVISCVEMREKNKCEPLANLALEEYDPTRIVAGSNRQDGLLLGNNAVGDEYERTCNNLMVGAEGYYSGGLREIVVKCDDFLKLPPVGTRTKETNYWKNCPDGHVVTGMRGGRGKDNMVGSLSFVCSPLDAMRKNLPVAEHPEFTIGGDRWDFSWNCPPRFAAVGIRGRASKSVDGLALICANF